MYSNKTHEMKDFIAPKHIKRSNDPIGDTLTRIRNAYARRFDSLIVPKSNQICNLLDALVRSGYLLHYEDQSEKTGRSHPVGRMKSNQSLYLTVFLKYYLGSPAILGIQRVSSPNKRIYMSKKDLSRYQKEKGQTKTMILSTSTGSLTSKEILSSPKYMGGESLCLVW